MKGKEDGSEYEQKNDEGIKLIQHSHTMCTLHSDIDTNIHNTRTQMTHNITK